MLTESLIIAGAIVVLVILTLIGLMSRYRRCASDEILVVFGKAGKKVQAIEMAPALAIQKMIETGMTPEMVVQYKTVDQLKGIAEVYEHIHLGEVTVYGNENTAGNFMASMA